MYQELLTQKTDLIRSLHGEVRGYIQHFFDHLDLAQVNKVFEHLLQLKGTIFLTGVGKSGIIAKKIAMTMSSSGTKALYLSPLNALHGDVGIVSIGDAVLLLSKSGETDELLHLCPTIRNKGASLIAIVSNPASRLSQACDLSVTLPVERELCPFDMVPTTSTLVQLAFGDLLAIALMRAKNFSMNDFVHNHPAGRLGKRLTFTVADLMITKEGVPLAHTEDELGKVLVEFSSKKCGCLLIVDQKMHLLGIFTDGDLRRSLQKFGADVLHKKMLDLMTLNPRSIQPDALAYDAMKFMESDQKRPITVLPVVSDKKVVGILKMHDIVQSGI